MAEIPEAVVTVKLKLSEEERRKLVDGLRQVEGLKHFLQGLLQKYA